jgi:hypothetical protein
VKRSLVLVGEVPTALTTVTSMVPAGWDGDRTVIMVSELMVKLEAGTVPKSTSVAVVKPEPLMTTWVPPAVLPEVVPRLVTAGSEVVL